MEYRDTASTAGQQKRTLTNIGKYTFFDEWMVTDVSESELYFLFELMEHRAGGSR